MAIEPGKTISHYRIIDKLGSGGMGDVYKAEDTKLRRMVALKFIPQELTRDEEARQRFIHEARTASALDYPNIGTIYEIDEVEGHFFIAMAYYEGETLNDKIKEGSLQIEEAINITLQILKGLQKAHEKDIVHRDIKPANLILTKDGQVKIIDFGIAKLKGLTRITKTGTTVGTIAYMSPEQAKGENVDHRTDIWSVGVILYEMLTGEKPFKAEYERALLYLILNENPEFMTKIRRDIPIELEKFVEKALVKNPDKRYQTIDEMLDNLSEITQEIKEGRSTTRTVFKLGRKQRKILFRFVPVIILIVILGVYLWQSKFIAFKPVSVVLLPMESIKEDPGQEWITQGMTISLIKDLSKIGKLRIVSLPSAMQYKGAQKSSPEIASELGIQYIINCSVIKIDKQIKISATLIDAIEDKYIWAESYERDFSDVLGLQGEIAQKIAGQIEIKLSPNEESRLTVSRKVNPETHELYLKGMYHLNKYTPEGISKGFEYLHQAVELDPDEPLVHAGLALAFSLVAHTPSPPPDAMNNSKEEAIRALQLDESLAEAHLALGMAKIFGDWDKDGAEKSFKRALELNPSLAQGYNQYSWFLLLKGMNEEAVTALRAAQKLDPVSPDWPAWTSLLFDWLERYDEAITEAQKSLELVPDFPLGLWGLGCAYAAKGRFNEAIELHQKLAELSLDWKSYLGQTYALAGRREEAIAVAEELENQPKVWYTWGLAEIYTALGDKDKAFYWLEEAYNQRHPYIQWICRNSNLKPLREDPRFTDLASRLNVYK